MIKALVLLIPVVWLSACSSFLYYPTQDLYTKPDSFPHPPTEVTFFSDDTFKLIAWHFKHKSPAKATLIVFHGNGQNISSHIMSSYWLFDEGYDIFIFDYPGYGGSTGPLNPKTTVMAGLKAIEYVKAQSPDQSIAIFGQSLGGAVAMKTLIQLNDRSNICHLALESTFDSYQKVAQKALAKTWITWPFQYLSYLLLSDAFAPGDDIKNISSIPITLFHRKNDPIVPYVFANRILSKAKEPKRLHTLPGQGHIDAFTSFDRSENRKTLLSHLKPCLNR